MDERNRLRVFWARLVMTVGIIWGSALLVTLLGVVFTIPENTDLLDAAVIINSFSIFLASVLAFWHRRGSYAWLLLDGTLVAVAMLHAGKVQMLTLLSAVVPYFLGAFLLATDVLGWPKFGKNALLQSR